MRNQVNFSSLAFNWSVIREGSRVGSYYITRFIKQYNQVFLWNLIRKNSNSNRTINVMIDQWKKIEKLKGRFVSVKFISPSQTSMYCDSFN